MNFNLFKSSAFCSGRERLWIKPWFESATFSSVSLVMTITKWPWHLVVTFTVGPGKLTESSAWALQPVLNWANVCSRTYLEVFGEPRWFLIGRTCLRKPSWKYSSKLYSGSKKLHSACAGNIRPIQQSLPLIGWEQSSPVDEEKIKMDDGVARFFTRFGGNLFICWLVEGAALSQRPRMR